MQCLLVRIAARQAYAARAMIAGSDIPVLLIESPCHRRARKAELLESPRSGSFFERAENRASKALPLRLWQHVTKKYLAVPADHSDAVQRGPGFGDDARITLVREPGVEVLHGLV